MELNTLYTLYKDEKMHKYLRENSEWYKYLNREPNYYKAFKKAIKDKYRLNPADKINDTIDNIDLVSTILKNIND